MDKITAVIQAGGLGTRMKELTKDLIPKPLLKLNGKPMIQWQIENLSKYEVKDFVIIVGHLGEQIKEYFKDGSAFGVNISYIEEKERLGSAGALYYLKNYNADKFILVYGDVMFDMDLHRWLSYHTRKNALITAVCHPGLHPQDSDIVIADENDRINGFLWKNEEREVWFPNFGNAGLFIFGKEVLKNVTVPEKKDFEKDIVCGFIGTGRVYAYRTSEYIKDVGTPERFKKASYEQSTGVWERKSLTKKQKCVFLDRDGTINKLEGLISDSDKLELEQGVADAIKMINGSDYLAIIVTNQPVVARGLCSIDDVRHINFKLETLLGREGAYLDDIVFCPHHPDKGYPEENPLYKIECNCRKPKTGMIDRMVLKYNIDLEKSFIVGDTTQDIQTGINAGLKTVLVHTGEAGQDAKYEVSADYEAANLKEAVETILQMR